MKTTRHPIDLLFPESRAALLRLLFCLPRRSFHVRELARRTDMPLSAVHQELHNLRTLGVLTSSSNGYHRFYSANPSHALFHPLSRLIAASDKLSTIDHVPYRRAKRRKKRGIREHSSPDLPVRWGIFEARTET
jgi:IclR helix-turn-helix domain